MRWFNGRKVCGQCAREAGQRRKARDKGLVSRERCGAPTVLKGTCSRYAGAGTGHPGEGRCRLHESSPAMGEAA